MIDLVQDTVEAFELPTGMCLTVRPSTGGAVGTISLLSGAVTLPAVSTPAGSGSATVGPFTVPCRVAVGARGTVSVEVTNAAVQSLVSGAGNDPAPAVRPSRGYVVAADLRAANIAASAGSPTITDVERIAPDGTKLRGVRIASTGAGTNCSFDINIRSQTFASGRLSFLVYSDHTQTGFDPNVSVYVGDSPGLTAHYVASAWQMNSRGWATISPGITGGAAHNKWSASGGATWGTTAFTRGRVRMDYTTTNTPALEVYELNYNEDATSWLSLTVDDGWESAYTLGAPAFERYGMRASFAIIADLIGTPGYMTWDQCRDLRDRGHEMVVHGPVGGTGSLVNYIASPNRRAAVEADVAFHRNALIREGLNVRGSANCYIYPQGYDRFAVGNEDIRDALESQGFIGGRRSVFSRQQKRSLRGGNPWTWHTIGHEWTTDPAEAANITTIVSRINGAATEKQDAVLMLHKFVTGPAAGPTEINMTNLETLLSAMADNRAAGTQDVVLFSRVAYAMAGLERPVV